MTEFTFSIEPWSRVLDRLSPGRWTRTTRGWRRRLRTSRPSWRVWRPRSQRRCRERIASLSGANAYNAVTAKFVLDLYPGIASVKEVDGFFDAKSFLVAGESLALDEIEGRARAEGDPRVHFAVVCASTSCPDLRFEPYRGVDLEDQLAEQTLEFLADTEKGLRFEGKELWVSSIFKWYAGDFTGGSTVVAFFARGKVLDWILQHLPEDLARRIQEADPSVKFLDYDWSLNDR